jgi:hypothetical protein
MAAWHNAFQHMTRFPIGCLDRNAVRIRRKKFLKDAYFYGRSLIGETQKNDASMGII